MRKPKEGKSEVTQRQARAVQLRVSGLTYEAIGARMGLTASGAWKVVRAATRSILMESVGELRLLEAARLDDLQAKVWKKAMRGDIEAVNCVLRIMDRRARLFGLDLSKPNEGQTEVTLAVRLPDGWRESERAESVVCHA